MNNEQLRPRKVSFGEAVQLYFANYVNFNGRASKSEYWWAVLFNYLVIFVLSMINESVGSIASLLLFLPTLSVSVRRLHDTGKAWYYYLFGCIPLAGFIILIVFFCQDSVGDNQWGLGPEEMSYTNY